jgi:hypothetical protein
MSPVQRTGVVVLFATAMGYLEAAVVYYLRTMVNRIVPYQADPLPNIPALALPELAREFATIVMLITVGCLAGRTWRSRIGFTLITFGIWDVTYYLFLIPLTGWPGSFLDWDILFLIPLPWWGPVLAPVSIALLMIVFGLLATLLELGNPPIWPSKLTGLVCSAGILLALYVFMRDAIAAVPHGEAEVRRVLPKEFPVLAFAVAWCMMFAPVADMSWQLANRYK